MRQHNDRQEKSLSIPAWDEKALTFRGSTQIPRSFLQARTYANEHVDRARETRSDDCNAVEACTFVRDVIGLYRYRLARGIHLLAGRNASSRAAGYPAASTLLSVYLRGGTWLACLPFLFICSMGLNPGAGGLKGPIPTSTSSPAPTVLDFLF